MNLVVRVKEHRWLGPAYRKLTSVVEVVPFYLMLEEMPDMDLREVQPGISPLEESFLTLPQVQQLAENPEVPEDVEELTKRFHDGCLCLGVWHDGALAAYSWCNLKECNYSERLVFPLGEDEAYLFDARTFATFRGKKLAGYVRYRLYQELNDLGRKRFYSTSSFLNKSALRFKERLCARRVRLYTYIGLFQKLHASVPLRRYSRSDDPTCI